MMPGTDAAWALELYYEWVEGEDGEDAFDAVENDDEYEAADSIWQYFTDYLYTLELTDDEIDAVFDNEEAVMEAIIGSLM